MILAMKALLGLSTILAAVLLTWWTERTQLTRPEFDRLSFWLFFGVRFGIYAVIFGVLGYEAQSDVNAYYDEGRAVLAGGIPMKSVATAYGPLFDYVVAVITLAWNSPRAIVLFSVFMEVLAFLVWRRVGRATFDEPTVRRTIVLYICNPVAIGSVAIDGQNQSWLSLFLAMALLALIYDRWIASGVSTGFALVAVKFLALIFVPVLFLGARRRIAWLAGFLVIPILGYGAILLAGGNPLEQVASQAGTQSSGNIPFLLTLAGVDISSAHGSTLTNLATLLVLICAFLAAWARFGFSTNRQIVLMTGFVLMIMMIFSKKAYGDYIVIALFPICLAVMTGQNPLLRSAYFAVVSAVSTIEPSLWFRWLHQGEMNLLTARVLPLDVTRAHVVTFFLCDVLLVAGYLGILALLCAALSHDDAGNRSLMFWRTKPPQASS